ncbi:glycoside hydrolase family 57 protein [Parachryseolinea silvisoli]|uniref:glycoside hydrolase family 57 protein n=1 Tax=Parachryseolinea silvisoli TaxID=2873601 RepID=UPI0022658834|nr:glycoside hydrolase family 57 protein [Parachryseolinea silvisoli]MCD9015120.1 glycoside hydrolase family 57 protein [Parachryseolinea silvisoli]
MNSDQRYLNLYFQVHQPRRLQKFQFFDVGSGQRYFDDDLNRDIVCQVAKDCYLPANTLLLNLIARHPDIRVTFSISGTALEQFALYAPEVLLSFRQLADTGAVEFLGETYYHSLAYFKSQEEFIHQVGLHKQLLRDVIGFDPTFFRHTELIYSDAIGKLVSELGFSGMYVEGAPAFLQGRTPNGLYTHPEASFALIPRNHRMSDDIAFRYADEAWAEWPLTGKKFASWIDRLPAHEKLVCLALDYETFGEHQKHSSGIFTFLQEFILALQRSGRFMFATPSALCDLMPAGPVVQCVGASSWADQARDLSAWLGNDMQRDAFETLYRFQDLVMEKDDMALTKDYRHLQTSDHFYYMSTKGGPDGGVHQYFSPYRSPYEAFMNYMNVLADLEFRLRGKRRGLWPSIEKSAVAVAAEPR